MRVVALVMVVASGAVAEEWADEKPQALTLAREHFTPRWGVVAGVHLGTAYWVTEGPLVGAKLGGRLRISQHFGVSLFAGWDFGTFVTSDGGFSSLREISLPIHTFNLLASVDLFTVSAFSGLFQPELALSLVGGAKFVIPPPMAPQPLEAPEEWPIEAAIGPQLQLLRLWPSKWWFPVYLQLLFVVSPRLGVEITQLVVGVGL